MCGKVKLALFSEDFTEEFCEGLAGSRWEPAVSMPCAFASCMKVTLAALNSKDRKVVKNKWWPIKQ